MIPQKLLDKILNIELEDDETPYGGTSFRGETVFDFLCCFNDDEFDSIEELNKALKECGIKPIKVEVL